MSEYIRASDGNGEPSRAYVVVDREVGDMLLNVDSVLNFPHKGIATTGMVDQGTGLIDPATASVFYFTLSGSMIHIDRFAPGYVDNGNTEGETVLLKPTTSWADEVSEGVNEAIEAVDQMQQEVDTIPTKVDAAINTRFPLQTVDYGDSTITTPKIDQNNFLLPAQNVDFTTLPRFDIQLTSGSANRSNINGFTSPTKFGDTFSYTNPFDTPLTMRISLTVMIRREQTGGAVRIQARANGVNFGNELYTQTTDWVTQSTDGLVEFQPYETVLFELYAQTAGSGNFSIANSTGDEPWQPRLTGSIA